MKKAVSKLGLSLFQYLVAGIIFQLVYFFICRDRFENEPWYWFGSMLFPLYLCSFPLFLLSFRKIEREKPEQKRLTLSKFTEYVLMTFSIGILTFIPGAWMDSLLLKTETELSEAVALTGIGYKILVMGIVAPVVEEYVFRKAVIDVVGRYDIMLAVVLSAICFSVSHGNLTQAVFTFFVGLLWGYIYITTGRIYYTMILHAMLNLSTILISSYLYFGSVAFILWCCFLLVIIFAGLIILVKTIKPFFHTFSAGEIGKEKEQLKGCLNIGLTLYFILCGGLFYMTYATM